MKSITRETLQSASVDQLRTWLASLTEKIAKGNISWKNSKNELIQCPWRAFNGQGAAVFTYETDPVLWDLATRVQIRCEAEKRNAGNIIAAFKATLQSKTGTLTASVRTRGLPVVKCPVMAQLAEAETVLSNHSRVQSELTLRTEAERLEEALQAEVDAMESINAEQKDVAAQLKAAQEEAKAKLKKQVKDAPVEVVKLETVPAAA